MSMSRSSFTPHSSRLRQRLQDRRDRDTYPQRRDQRALVPIINAGDDISPALERRLAPTVERAHRGDADACAALYLAFCPKLVRFISRIHAPRLGPDLVGIWERDDVEQEAWIVFRELIDSWTPERPFGRYVLANFPWRLRDAVFRGVARTGVPPRITLVPIGDQNWLHDGSTAADEARVLLDAVADRLPPIQGVILRRHIGAGEPLAAIARDLGISRRTITRHWRTLRDHLTSSISSSPQARKMA